MPDDDQRDDDKKVKDLDHAQLAKWFGLPSFDQVEDERKAARAEEDPEVVAVRERRQKILAEIDPAFLAAIDRRLDPPDDLFQVPPPLPSRVDPTIAQFDFAMVENRAQIAEPREYERPEDIEDELHENTPQALLRDLHRVETDFEKLFEVVDIAAEQRVDAVAEVRSAMTTSWKLELVSAPGDELRATMAELKADREKPWADVVKTANLPNRRVTE